MHYETVEKLVKVSPNIVYAPEINFSYADVVNNNNVGSTVRWGGEVVDSFIVDESVTQLTVSQLPLDSSGRPQLSENTPNVQRKNYFIVNLKNGFAQNFDFNGDLITFYGDVAGKQTILVDGRNLLVPSLNLLEVVDWDVVDREVLANQRRRANYYYHNVSHRYHGGRFGHGFGSSFGHSSRIYRGGGFGRSGGYCRY